MSCAHCCNACRQALSLGTNSSTIEKHSDACVRRARAPAIRKSGDDCRLRGHTPPAIETAISVHATRTCESNSIASAASCGVSSAAS